MRPSMEKRRWPSSNGPLDALDWAGDDFSHAAVIVVTNPAGIAGWVSLDLPSRVERHVSEPVITVEVDPTGTD